ncbi:AraC family ligand binding domain-containing protein [Draconibacterium halophilum]|uniref:AraC-type arabinose-binding/dimerisation domain-containing protein n=1 Tax=Draconibacterium halophilum TaxID=2706887 RepID=A0A6C0RC12_9BACT|nr:AraC family ligand binding domain-containing protein [Draconibacterium halophilum]QIA07442.1 hypothetical protein G0Q07_06750 [Draconibacterium halophilum]
MKLMHEQIDFPGKSVVIARMQEKQCFTYPWHFHSEYEIIYVLDGYGTRFVADSIEEFDSDDFVLMASNLPHFWKTDASYHEKKNHKKLSISYCSFLMSFSKRQFWIILSFTG